MKAQKGPSTIRLRYPVPGTILVGTGAGFEKKWLDIRPPEPDIQYIPKLYTYNFTLILYSLYDLIITCTVGNDTLI